MRGIEKEKTLNNTAQSLLFKKHTEIGLAKIFSKSIQIMPNKSDKKVLLTALLITLSLFFCALKKEVFFESVTSMPEIEIAWHNAISGRINWNVPIADASIVLDKYILNIKPKKRTINPVRAKMKAPFKNFEPVIIVSLMFFIIICFLSIIYNKKTRRILWEYILIMRQRLTPSPKVL